MLSLPPPLFFFFFNDTATTEIYTLSLHDALPIFEVHGESAHHVAVPTGPARVRWRVDDQANFPVPHQPERVRRRSEEHTSELQSRLHLVCRLLLEKKKR